MKIIPTTTVPNKLLVSIAMANAGIAANSLKTLAESEIDCQTTRDLVLITLPLRQLEHFSTNVSPI